jgi:LytS/YehU family sensor histidine kinase
MIHFNQFELMILAMGIMVMTVSTFLRVTRRLREAEEEKASAELSYLKAQINPHFLFNTLNSIYSLAYKKSDQTAPAIVKLSGLMRYVITEAQEDQVLLSTEMEYLSNYVELQRLRLASSTNLKFAVKGDPEDKLISPLIFLPFIENAFKYGVNPEKHSDIKIDFVITSNSIHMEVVNSVVNTDEISSERIGVGNSKERLERMYPGSYLLNIRPGKETFSVSLHIHFQ